MSFKLAFHSVGLIYFFSCQSEWHYDVVSFFAHRINHFESSRFPKLFETLDLKGPFFGFEVELLRSWNLVTRYRYLLNHELLYSCGNLCLCGWLWRVSASFVRLFNYLRLFSLNSGLVCTLASHISVLSDSSSSV